jgi:hypothetical protein
MEAEANGPLVVLQREWVTLGLFNSRQPQGKNIQVESWQQTTRNIISPCMFLLDHVGNGNDDISSEEHFKNFKTKRDSYLLLQVELLILCKYWNSISLRSVIKFRKVLLTVVCFLYVTQTVFVYIIQF